MTTFSAETARILRSLLTQPDAIESPASVHALHALLDKNAAVNLPLHRQPFRWWMTATEISNHATRTGHPPTGNDGASNQVLCWIRNQRRARLDLLKETFLDSIPGWEWEPRQERWETNAHDFTQFVALHHRAPATHATCAKERQLARWLRFQRAQMRSATFPEGRAIELHKIPYLVPLRASKTPDLRHKVASQVRQ